MSDAPSYFQPAHALDRIHETRVIRRFSRKVDAIGHGGCWLWTAATDKRDYGVFWYDKRTHWAHRIAYAIWRGKIPNELTVNHVCMNHWCVNPHHLELLSHADNAVEATIRRWINWDGPSGACTRCGGCAMPTGNYANQYVCLHCSERLLPEQVALDQESEALPV